MQRFAKLWRCFLHEWHASYHYDDCNCDQPLASGSGDDGERRSWLIATTALGILSVSFGAPVITIVALKPIAAEFGNVRSLPAFAVSLAWLGSAVAGISMGRIAERPGVRWTIMFGALMIAAGLVLSSVGGRWSLYIGHGVLMGVLGNAGINAPLYVYIALVRSPARHRTGADRQRPGGRRDDLGRCSVTRSRLSAGATRCSFMRG